MQTLNIDELQSQAGMTTVSSAGSGWVEALSFTMGQMTSSLKMLHDMSLQSHDAGGVNTHAWHRALMVFLKALRLFICQKPALKAWSIS